MLWEYLVPPSEMGRVQRCAIAARDSTVYFKDGSSGICLTSGLWNVNFGYGNDYVTRSIIKVLESGHYLSMFRQSHQLAVDVTKRFLKKLGWGDGSIVFSTSGSALNDVIVKLARQYSSLTERKQARAVVSLRGSYHGMTLNSMGISGDSLGQALYGAYSFGNALLPPDDSAAWHNFFQRRGETIALVIVEPLLGTGVIEPDQAVLREIFEARRKYGFLLAADEVATGFYRLGRYAASQDWAEEPDLIGFSKALTNGAVASSMLAISDQVSRCFVDNDALFIHAETQGGSPIAAAATQGVFDYIDSVQIGSLYQVLCDCVEADLDAVSRRLGLIHRGRGLFHYLGWSLGQNTRSQNPLEMIDFFKSKGVVVHPSHRGIQIVPQVSMPPEKWSEAVFLLEEGLASWIS